jgi:hypothetical protein
MYLLITRERIEISQKFQHIWIQQAKTIFFYEKIPQKFGCNTVKNNPKHSLLIFWFRVNILKNKKVEFQNNQMGALLKASKKFGEKSGSRH